MKKVLLGIGAVFVLLVVIGLIAGPPKKKAPAAAPSTSPTVRATTQRVTPPAPASPSTKAQPSASPSPAGIALTGLGATDAAWATRHTLAHPVHVTVSNAVYGPPVPGQPNTFEWQPVTHLNGRVDGYVVNLPKGTSIASAEQTVMADLPADAKATPLQVEHDSLGNSCGLWNLTSPELAQALGPKPWGDPTGVIGISFDTPTADLTGIAYTPSDVEVANVSIIPMVLDGTNC